MDNNINEKILLELLFKGLITEEDQDRLETIFSDCKSYQDVKSYQDGLNDYFKKET